MFQFIINIFERLDKERDEKLYQQRLKEYYHDVAMYHNKCTRKTLIEKNNNESNNRILPIIHPSAFKVAVGTHNRRNK